MYKKEKAVALKGSTSALYNNLSTSLSPEKNFINYAVVHKAVVNLVHMNHDNYSIATVNYRQVVCREPTPGHGSTIVLQAKFITFASRTLLVITSQMGIQIYESDTSLLIYWFALKDEHRNETGSSFGRGICGILDTMICVGDHKGSIQVFKIPTSGTNVTLIDTLSRHEFAICSLESEDNKMVSSDDFGTIIVWQLAGSAFKEILRIKGLGFPVPSVALWQDLVICGYATGHLRVFSAQNGRIVAEATAHGRGINAVDVCKSGMVLTAGEDSFIQVFQLTSGASPNLLHKFGEAVTDLQLQGAKFTSDDGLSFAVTGYDSNDLVVYTIV